MKKLLLFAVSALLSVTLCAQTAEKAKELHEKGRACLNEGKITEGREYTRQAMEMRRELFGEVNEDYITSLNNYALSFATEGNYARAVELQEQVMDLCRKLKSPHPNLGMYTTNMGRFYYHHGNITQAVNCWEQALPLVEKHGDIYEYLLNALGMVYDERNDKAGLERIMALTKEHNCHELSKPCDEPECMLERAEYYTAINDHAHAKECFLRVLAMPMSQEMKVKVHEAYAKQLFQVNDYVPAVEYQLSAAKLRKEIDGKETETSIGYLYRAALFSYIGKQYRQAVDCYLKIIDFYTAYDAPAARRNEIQCYEGLGNAYSALKEYEQAYTSYRKVMDYYEANAPESEEYPKAILHVATAEKDLEAYDDAIGHYQQAMELFEAKGMAEEYSYAASSLKLCYFYAGKKGEVDGKDKMVKKAQNEKTDRIIEEELANLKLTETYLGKLIYARSLATIAGCYTTKEDYRNAVTYYTRYISAIREAIQEEFRLQSESERMAIWNEELPTLQELQLLLATLPVGNEGLMNELAAVNYDAELLSKGILLTSSIEFKKVLTARNDQTLLETYNRLQAMETEIGQLRKNGSVEQHSEKLLGLMQESQSLQLKLYKECAEFADYTDYLSYSWQDVQKALEPTDVAIEFAAIRTGILDSENYMAALILTADAPTPVAFPVCLLAQAQQMETDGQLFGKKDNPLWGNLSSYLSGKKRIFFSADGSFNRIGIEYLLYNGKPLSEQFEVYRLSSTKELCYRHPEIPAEKAVLFGDIDYNDAPTRSEATERSLSAMRGAIEDEGFIKLKHAPREINDIRTILQEHHVKDIATLTGTDASKTAFLQLDGTKVNLVHIATHGTYLHAEKASDAASMENSLLAFAGANLGNEGLMTAAEIATMNLRQCELVVLSACETGLGKLSEDGVFGLQRGFKNAGVRTLLMSLKKVYDSSTADLMTFFYKYLMEGSTKREALIKAQQDVRASGYTDPAYWATFILLDAY